MHTFPPASSVSLSIRAAEVLLVLWILNRIPGIRLTDCQNRAEFAVFYTSLDVKTRWISGYTNEKVSGTSVCKSTATASAGVGFTFICFWNLVWDCHVPALIPSTPR